MFCPQQDWLTLQVSKGGVREVVDYREPHKGLVGLQTEKWYCTTTQLKEATYTTLWVFEHTYTVDNSPNTCLEPQFAHPSRGDKQKTSAVQLQKMRKRDCQNELKKIVSLSPTMLLGMPRTLNMLSR